MTFNESMRNLVSQALALASSKYLEFAADALEMPGGDRLCKQFRLQAIQAREAAILIGDAEWVEIRVDGRTAHDDARRIVAQEVIDLENSRMAGFRTQLSADREVGETEPRTEV